jgi:hypothetical protein
MPIDGVRETVEAFRRVEREMAMQARRAVERAVERIKADAIQRCPMGLGEGPFPGHVIDQIRSQMAPDEPRGAVFVERRGIGGRWGTDNVGLWLEYGTSKMPAYPFLGPAAEAERPRHYQELSAALDRGTKVF